MFYHYSQNNSGGSFEFDKKRGITHHVVIEADSPSHANERAESIGLYFNGCENDRDCPCCGDRWYPVHVGDGTEKALVYDKNPEDHKDMWFKEDSVAVHQLDGSIVWY